MAVWCFAFAAAGAALAGPSAWADWRASSATTASLAYNNGIAVDRARGDVFFTGVSSTSNSALYRATSRFVQTAANSAAIPATPEGYNHIGDLSFDPRERRLMLPLECYYPTLGGNTCGIGAIGVADPVTLRFLYYVNLDTSQISKAMWAEVSPDGHWVWTSSGTHLLAYRTGDVNRATADGQRSAALSGIAGTDLGAVLPTGSVTGATFYEDATTRGTRLFLALNEGTRSTVVSYGVTARSGRPMLSSRIPRTETTRAQSATDYESEGLAATGAGVMRWLMLPQISNSTLYSRILTYKAVPPPPRDGTRVQPGQRLRPALEHGLRLTVVCNQRCTTTAVATIGGGLARRLGLASPRSTVRHYPVGTGALHTGSGTRTLTVGFRAPAAHALRCQSDVKLLIAVRSVDAATRVASLYTLSTALM